MKGVCFTGIAWLLASVPLLATHIVGGELSLQHVQDSRYALSLNLYFDDINGERDAEDSEIVVAIFSKRTNQRIAYYVLPRVAQELVAYTNVACTNSRLQTRQIQYSAEVTLNPSDYDEAQGYYASWERCCRNETIVNIREPGASGMVYYLEFPALTQNGNRFLNSSPAFQMPKGDYACVNKPFTFAFGATDADGDSLHYSLVTPYQGNSEPGGPGPFNSIPGPNPGAGLIFYPAPYSSVSWQTGYGATNAIPGNPPLRVNAITGELAFTASQTGLYVFAVLCEEYRNGMKIGEVRRDYQLLVIDCPPSETPQVYVWAAGETDFYQLGDTLVLLYAADSVRCFEALVTDADENTTVRVDIRALNFPADAFTYSPVQTTLRNASDTLRSQVCFNGCVVTDDGRPLQLELIASDDDCPQPRRDTLLVYVMLELRPSAPPTVETDLPGNRVTVTVNQLIQFNVTVTDPDSDYLTLRAVGRGFELAAVGMQFENRAGTGQITSPFSWTPPCETAEQSGVYVVDFIAEDNSCQPDRFDTVTVKLTLENYEVVLTKFQPPNVFTPNGDGVNDMFQIPDLPADQCSYVFERIQIYNRWGRPVYESQSREFAWSGLGFPTGMYYYRIFYGASSYKGWVSLLR